MRNADALGDVSGTILHSDYGSQSRSRNFVELLRQEGITRSMGRAGACGDNATMEPSIALLQENVLDKKNWHTRQELRLTMVTWIDRIYHRRRRE